MGDDLIYGNMGEDGIRGHDGADTIFGGKQIDSLWGEAGDDLVNGNMGDDAVVGGEGNDTLNGGQDNDLLWGDAGNDLLYGNKGNDTLRGGAGADMFYLQVEGGTDYIADYNYARETGWSLRPAYPMRSGRTVACTAPMPPYPLAQRFHLGPKRPPARLGEAGDRTGCVGRHRGTSGASGQKQDGHQGEGSHASSSLTVLGLAFGRAATLARGAAAWRMATRAPCT